VTVGTPTRLRPDAKSRPAAGTNPPRSQAVLERRWFRAIVVVLGAAALVVVVSLVMRACAEVPGDDPTELRGPLAAAVTGTTDQITPGEMAAGISALPATARRQPAQDEWEALLPRLEQAAQASPGDAEAQRTLALAYYNLGRLEEAAAIYESLLADGEDAVLRNRLGNTLRDLGDPAGAEAAYRRAMADDGGLAAPYLNLAEVLWRQDRVDESLATIDQGLVAVPEADRAALERARRVVEQDAR
jgi:Tfp pilus assembly protein PilF